MVKERMLNQDIAYIYDPSQTIIKKKIQLRKDSIRVFLSFADPHTQLSEEDFARRFNFYYKITEDYESAALLHKDSVSFRAKDLIRNANVQYLSFDIPKPAISNSLLIVERYDHKRKIMDLIDIPLVHDSASAENTFMIYDKKKGTPVLENYILKNDSFRIKAANVQDYSGFRILGFGTNFQPSLNPYTIEDESENLEKVKPETEIAADLNQGFTFPSPGFYFLSAPESQAGFSLLAVDNKFPRLTRPEEMIGPLAYITTAREYARMKESLTPKFTLDSFWLSIGGSEEYSKKLIKTYYQKVEYANRSFTSYKEGWKTDRGMIYIVFGKPDAVYRHNDQEEWDYENVNENSLTFSFRKRNDLYSNDDDYELVRKPVYEAYWKFMVEKWRKGNIIK
ncbi:MAG: GWxTD domain-containing protein [Cytophagaceae bacterium]